MFVVMPVEAFKKITRSRNDFPFLQEKVGAFPLVYLDSAASAQKPTPVIQRMTKLMESEYANVHRGIHILSERATAAYEEARSSVASLLHAEREEEIVFTRGTTEAVNLVAETWGRKNILPGDVILLTEMEHHSNLLPWQHLANEMGAVIKFVPVLENGTALDLEVAQQLLSEQPKLFAFVHVPNTLGLENPVDQLCSWSREYGVMTFIDAAQSVGHQEVDVQKIGCDFLACSSHKMCGPSGIGALYGRYELLEAMPPWQLGGEMVERVFFDKPPVFRTPPARFEAGTPAIIEAAGWSAAIKYLQEIGFQTIQAHSIELANKAVESLSTLEGLHIYGPKQRQSGIVTFSVEGIHPHDIAFFVNERGIALRAGHHCAQPLMRKLGHVASNRASFYLYNTLEEIEKLHSVLQEAIYFFRS